MIESMFVDIKTVERKKVCTTVGTLIRTFGSDDCSGPILQLLEV